MILFPVPRDGIGFSFVPPASPPVVAVWADVTLCRLACAGDCHGAASLPQSKNKRMRRPCPDRLTGSLVGAPSHARASGRPEFLPAAAAPGTLRHPHALLRFTAQHRHAWRTSSCPGCRHAHACRLVDRTADFNSRLHIPLGAAAEGPTGSVGRTGGHLTEKSGYSPFQTPFVAQNHLFVPL